MARYKKPVRMAKNNDTDYGTVTTSRGQQYHSQKMKRAKEDHNDSVERQKHPLYGIFGGKR
jgi:hypothetical protein